MKRSHRKKGELLALQEKAAQNEKDRAVRIEQARRMIRMGREFTDIRRGARLDDKTVKQLMAEVQR